MRNVAVKVHELKILNEYFVPVLTGKKCFEIRKNDRDYKVGDVLILREWIPNLVFNGENQAGNYTGRKVCRVITYIFNGGNYGVSEDTVILGITDFRYYTLL